MDPYNHIYPLAILQLLVDLRVCSYLNCLTIYIFSAEMLCCVYFRLLVCLFTHCLTLSCCWASQSGQSCIKIICTLSRSVKCILHSSLISFFTRIIWEWKVIYTVYICVYFMTWQPSVKCLEISNRAKTLFFYLFTEYRYTFRYTCLNVIY